MATSPTTSSTQTLTTADVTITIVPDVSTNSLSIDITKVDVLPGTTIQWKLPDGNTAPFAIAFGHPFFNAPEMLFGTPDPVTGTSMTQVYTVVTPLLSSQRPVHFSYQVMYMNIENTQQYTFIGDDPVVIVDPSGGSN